MCFFSLLRVGAAVVLLAALFYAGAQAAPNSAGNVAAASPGGLSGVAAIRRLIESGHGDEALKQLDTLAAQTPVPPGIDTLRGLAFYNGNHFAQADAAFAAALRADPGDEEAAQMRGLTLFRMGKPADAIPLLTGGRPAGRQSAQAKADPNYVLALCYIDTRRYDDARHAFAAQYGFPSDSAPAYLLAARMLLRREYLPVAQGFAEKALTLDPQLPLAHALLGEIALGGNHLDEAIAQFSEEQQRNPLEPNVYDRLGDAYSRSGKYPEAIAALQRAVLLEPNATGPYILLGKVMLKRQDAVGAATYLERAKSMDPANYMTRSLLGQAYRAMGRRDEAAQELQAAEQLQAASEPKLATPQ